MSQYISVFDMLKIGIGPSSSHTLGPWCAAKKWISELENLNKVGEVKIHLYGALALTGKGHATDKAILLGLMAEDSETIEKSKLEQQLLYVNEEKRIKLNGTFEIPFNPDCDILFHKGETLTYHPNGMKFQAIDNGKVILEDVFYSIGGGFIVKEGELFQEELHSPLFECNSSSELIAHCLNEGMDISDIVLQNEKVWRSEPEIRSKMLRIWEVMKGAAYEGCHCQGTLPGGLNVKRRAFEMNKQLLRVHQYSNANEWIEAMKVGKDFSKVLMRVSCLAIAVNEVNASMGRIVTAPTNGSAGVLPAVLFYYLCFSGRETSEDDIVRFLLTAAEIGKYFKMGATISAAAGGCQAEIGVSSAMAAAALTERMGGTPAQVLMAAEIAAEHHLGLTCDPVGGLVQIPCIERNSMGAIKAITACMIALSSDPAQAKVSLDMVIKTMKETAENMNNKYKETSLGGLAVNIGVNLPEC